MQAVRKPLEPTMTQPNPLPPRRQNLPRAVRILREAIDRLTQPTAAYINNQYIEVPGLYLQLLDAIKGQQGTGNGSVARSLPPVWVDAADQLNNIDLIVDVWVSVWKLDYRRGVPTTVARLKAVAARTWTVEQTRQVRRLAGIINAWADDIDTLLNYQHVKYISAPCPACGAETAQHRDSAGELVRSPALQVVTELGCTCQECGHYWAPDKYIDLCRELGFVLPAGVLE